MPPRAASHRAAARRLGQPGLGQRYVAAPGEPPLHGQRGLAVPQQHGGRGLPPADRPAGGRGGLRGVATVLPLCAVTLPSPRLSPARLVIPGRVHGLVREPVGVRVAGSRHPGIGHPAEPPRHVLGRAGQRAEVRVLDLPAARHLLDDQLRVHPDLDVGARGEFRGGAEPGHQARVLGHVVRRRAQALPGLGQHLAGRRVADQRAVPRRARVAAGAAVGLDDEPAAHCVVLGGRPPRPPACHLPPASPSHFMASGRPSRLSPLIARTRGCGPGSCGTPRSAAPRPGRRP